MSEFSGLKKGLKTDLRNSVGCCFEPYLSYTLWSTRRRSTVNISPYCCCIWTLRDHGRAIQMITLETIFFLNFEGSEFSGSEFSGSEFSGSELSGSEFSGSEDWHEFNLFFKSQDVWVFGSEKRSENWFEKQYRLLFRTLFVFHSLIDAPAIILIPQY